MLNRERVTEQRISCILVTNILHLPTLKTSTKKLGYYSVRILPVVLMSALCLIMAFV